MRVRKWADKALWFVLGVVTAGGLVIIPSSLGGTSAQKREGYRDTYMERSGSKSDKDRSNPCNESQKEARGPRHD
jgi:hypothetical protein